MQIKRIDLTKEGIEIFLGPTEARIMRSLWDKPKSLKDLHNEFILSDEKTLAYSTVHTDLTRLVDKQLVRKAINGAEIIYRPIYFTEDAFLGAALDQVKHALSSNFNITLSYEGQ